MNKTFSIRQALAFGFGSFFNHIGVLLLAALTIFAIAIGVTLVALGFMLLAIWLLGLQVKNISQTVSSDDLMVYWESFYSSISSAQVMLVGLLSLLFFLFVAWLMYGLWIGYVRMLLDIYEYDSTSVSQLFSCMKRAPKIMVAQCLVSIVVALGMAFLLIPGFVAMAYYGFVVFYLLEFDSGILSAFSYSSRLATGIVGKLMGFYLVMISLWSVSSIMPPVAFVVVPSLILANIFVYKKLQEQS